MHYLSIGHVAPGPYSVQLTPSYCVCIFDGNESKFSFYAIYKCLASLLTLFDSVLRKLQKSEVSALAFTKLGNEIAKRNVVEC